MTILEDLYYGNLHPWERKVEKGSQEDKTVKIIASNEEKLISTLSEQQKELFIKAKDSYKELLNISEREAFVNGYTLATRIMVEVMQGLTEVEDI